MENKDILTKELRKILPIFIKEFREYIHPEKLKYFESEENIANIIQYSNNHMGAFTKGEHIYYSNINKAMFEKLKLHPNYGTNPDKKLVEPDQFVNNKKDYLDYINYCIEKGVTELGYSLDVLPHEIMHLIGSHGGVIGEGVTELRTRQICQKYGIRCAPVLHSKETEVVAKLDKIFGKQILNKAAFENNNREIQVEFDKIYGAREFWKAYVQMVTEYDKYGKNNLQNPIEHYKAYRNVNYGPMLELLDRNYQKEIE